MPATVPKAGEGAVDGVVVGLEHFTDARAAGLGVDVLVTRYRDSVIFGQDTVRVSRWAIDVDDEPGISGQDCRGIQPIGQTARNRSCTDVIGNMAVERIVTKA